MSAEWAMRLAAYKAATADYDEARKYESRLYRIFRRLSGRMSDDRAYDLAGIELADHRSLRAYRQMMRARAAFAEVMSTAPTCARVLAQCVCPKSYTNPLSA